MNQVTEYALRRTSDKAVIVTFLVRDDQSFSWTPADYVPKGKMQWYRRPLGKKRWFKVGEVFSYER